MATEAVPITITPEAEAFIDEVGQRREFEAMLEHIRQTFPGLRSFEVELHDFPETGPPGITIWVHRDDPRLARTPPGEPLGPWEDDPTDRQYRYWKVTTFPPEVCVNFATLSAYHSDGR